MVTRLLAFVALCVVCATVAVAGMVVLASLLWPAVNLAARAAGVVFDWMQANTAMATALMIVAAVGVLAWKRLTDD